MEKIRQKLKIITNFINDILYKKKLVIFLGKKGIKITAYHKHDVVNSIFIDRIDPELITIYQTFLKKHKKFQVSFLLDSEECQLKHEFMPMLQSIIKFNPVEKFIQENYKSEDIIAYNVYNVDHKNGEVWEASIAFSPYNNTINDLLEFVIHNSSGFEGVYFLSLEFESIIDTIIERKNLSELQNDLQIFVTVTEVNDIRIATKYQKNILEEAAIVFPFDKSDLYIVGTIEQAISDIVLKYKAYVKSLDLKICLIFACDQVLSDLLIQSTLFQPYKMIVYNDTLSAVGVSNQHFQDNSLLELFMANKKHLALNKTLRLITKLTKIDSVVFKPLITIIAGIIIALSAFKYQSVTIQKETILLNNKYYLLSEKYRNIKKRHPEIENIGNLAELYKLQTILDTPTPMPFDSLQKVFLVKNANIEVVGLNWYATGSYLLDKETFLILEIVYMNNNKEMKVAKEVLNTYVKDIKIVFQGHKVTYTNDYNNITELSKKLIIPARIIISGAALNVR